MDNLSQMNNTGLMFVAGIFILIVVLYILDMTVGLDKVDKEQEGEDD